MNEYECTVTNKNGLYAIKKKNGELLKTPQGAPIQSKNVDYIDAVANYVRSHGENLGNGLSLYGLASSYIDFGFQTSHSEKKLTILASLRNDPVLRSESKWLMTRLSIDISIETDLGFYTQGIFDLVPNQVCSLVCYVANFGSPILGYNFVILGKPILDYVVRTLCGTFEHVAQFEVEKLKEAALQGAFIDNDTIISVDINGDIINYCRACCFREINLDSRCFLLEQMNWVKEFASFESI